MKKSLPSFDRSHARDAWIPSGRRTAPANCDAYASHAAAPLPLTRIFHPYEYWAHVPHNESGADVYVSTRTEPDPPKSGWPAAPPLASAGWLRRWTVRGALSFRRALA
ncbi:hypothetical protein [Paraburkholderia ferrariae]|uniref:hypothetical protein n=1 Tax=Paraburkholderia ferrariae TaxID=386056 RepID=UPI000488935A|nr:hypothetical protein [Paraburkholderia ferrariae]